MEGKSCPSEVLVCTTSPDRPGPPTRPLIKGPVTSHGFSVKWGMCAAAISFYDRFFKVIFNDKPKGKNKETSIICGELRAFEMYMWETSGEFHRLKRTIPWKWNFNVQLNFDGNLSGQF